MNKEDILNKTNLAWVVIVLVGVIILWNMGILSFPNNREISEQDAIIDQNTTRIDSLRGVITGLEVNQLKYDATISSLKDSLVVLNTQIDNNETKIKDLKKKYNEKVNSISSYSSNQLEDFLTDRYK
jgi:chromosome segregation ATPase